MSLVSDLRNPYHTVFDFTQDAIYYVTICAFQEMPLFGEVYGGQMHLNPCGELVRCEWLRLKQAPPFLVLDSFIVMPNHLHAVLGFRNLQGDTWARGAFESSIANFKQRSTLQINTVRGTEGVKIWQRHSYDRLVKGAQELDYLRQYIDCNPTRWQADEYYTTAPSSVCPSGV